VKQLLFVCGFGSGGTDLTKTILNAHPDIHIADEIPHLGSIKAKGYQTNLVFNDIRDVRELQRVLRELDVSHGIDNLDYNFDADIAEKQTISRDEVLRKCLWGAETRVWGAKAPAKLTEITDFAELFPDARFLIITRDVRDVCLSWKNKWGKDVIWCSAKWATRMKAGWELTRRLADDRYMFVKFEDFLAETEASCARICAFLQIPFSDRMLHHHLYTPAMRGKINYGQRIKRDNRDKWRTQLPRPVVSRIEEIAYDTMELLGYRPEIAAYRKPMTRYEKLRGVGRDSWSMLFVGNRASSNNTFKRRLETVGGEIRGLLLRIPKSD
jgi:hypothetical protein